MSIPMPGHPVPEASLASTKQAVTQLERLFDDHDVIYLLMDSRESRWLPTLLGAAKGKVSTCHIHFSPLDKLTRVSRASLS